MTHYEHWQLLKKIMELENKINHKVIRENFEKNSFKILPIFYEMQSTFLSGIYKRYGDLEGGQIVIYFARNLHLKVMRKREEDLDFDLSLDKFWFNHKNTMQDKLKIIFIGSRHLKRKIPTCKL